MTAPVLIHSFSPWCVGPDAASAVAGLASGSWPSANRAIYIPLDILEPTTIVKIGWVNGGTASGNVDLGIYRASDLALIVSTGSTAQGTISVAQEVNIADTTLGVGEYLIGFAVDNTTATFARSGVDVRSLRMAGITQQASAFPLPSTAVPAAAASSYLPLVTLATRTLLA